MYAKQHIIWVYMCIHTIGSINYREPVWKLTSILEKWKFVFHFENFSSGSDNILAKNRSYIVIYDLL